MNEKKMILLKTELKKMLHKKSFHFFILFGCILAVLTVAWAYKNMYIPNEKLRLDILERADSVFIQHHEWFEASILQGWLGYELYSPYNTVFFLLFPLLAAAPYGYSLHYELNSGYAKQILAKCRRQDYFTSKFAAVFISGGITVAVPLLFGLIVAACFFPAVSIDPMSLQSNINPANLWVDLFYEKPVLYALAYTGIDFVYGGLFACMALAISGWCANGFLAVVFPFILNTAFTKVISFAFFGIHDYVAGNLINPQQGFGFQFGLATVATVAAGMLLTCIGIYWLNNRKYDVLE
ncbi:MAG: hypothetical protein NC393_08950 [Clostridium sp.]|nr:hypothetical protein [Clostridium sp.]MCM1172239.1 hypothetical protein [Clostridium sp.]MCM1209279.1 hypothetical protein [Ruminococcus sp.]